MSQAQEANVENPVDVQEIAQISGEDVKDIQPLTEEGSKPDGQNPIEPEKGSKDCADDVPQDIVQGEPESPTEEVKASSGEEPLVQEQAESPVKEISNQVSEEASKQVPEEASNEISHQISKEADVQEESAPHLTSTEVLLEENQEAIVHVEDKEQQCSQEAKHEVHHETSSKRVSPGTEDEPLHKEGSQEIHEGHKAKSNDMSKTCPPKLAGDLSLKDMDESEEVAKKSLKERESPSKKLEELEAPFDENGESAPHPDSKDLKQVKENETSSPREVTN